MSFIELRVWSSRFNWKVAKQLLESESKNQNCVKVDLIKILFSYDRNNSLRRDKFLLTLRQELEKRTRRIVCDLQRVKHRQCMKRWVKVSFIDRT